MLDLKCCRLQLFDCRVFIVPQHTKLTVFICMVFSQQSEFIALFLFI